MVHDPNIERERALEQLPTAYALALRMRDAGGDDSAIAAALALPVDTIPDVIALAEAKLSALPGATGTNASPDGM